MKLFLPIILCCFVLTAGSFRSRAQDYTITTTGNEIVITDNSGNGETLTVSESGSNIRFVVTPNTRTYRINSGAITAFTTPADVALAGINAITINGAGGNDNINMGAFAANLPNLTINGGTGDDQVNFNGDIPIAANANLDVDMQNDDAAPGLDRVTVAANANLILTGTGTATVKMSRDVLISTSGSIETADGNLTVEANQQAMPSSGNFEGVRVSGGALKISGTGLLDVKGKGGNSGADNRGVVVDNAGKIEGGSGTVTVQGTGGAASSIQNIGVLVSGVNARITSSGGAVSVTGKGGGTGTSAINLGVVVGSTGEITAGGSGTVTVQGTGGATSGNSNIGVYVLFANSRITSSGGAVTVTGQGGGTGTSGGNYGVWVNSAGEITADGSGTVTVQGTGGATSGNANYGVYVDLANSRITSSGGAVSVTGIEGDGSTGIGFLNSSSGTVTTAANGGNISIMANTMNINAPVSTNTGSSVTLKPFSSGVAINLGSTSNPIGGPLGLSDAELDLISTGTLMIGDANSGDISISNAISLPAATNVQLRSGGDITFNQHFNTGGGTLLLAPGNTPAAVKPTFTGTDATASTVSFASDLSIAINGTTPGDGTGSTFTRLTVAGSVDLTGVDLVFSGAYVPVLGNTFTIVDNDGVDDIVNTFTGLAEGARISNFLGSGLDATITYLGGDGNDVVLTVVAAPLPDYTITTTGNAIVITDISGNGETLTVSESGSNIRFVVTPTTRTYRINSGAITAFTTAADIALTGMNAITINTAAGNDIINMAAFAANLPSLTINGGTGDDQVNFNGDISFAANANLDVDLQNDDAAPGLDRVTIATNANLILTGTGTATVKVSRSVLINTSGSIETADGNLTVEANQQAMPSSGAFGGVRVSGGVLKINGIGLLDVKGKGGNSGVGNIGVLVVSAGKIEGGSGTVTVQGTGGAASGDENFGVYITSAGSRITSSGGAVSVTGQGGGTGISAANFGVYVQSAGEITAGGSGTVMVQGTGGAASVTGNFGIWVRNVDSRITSSGGAVSVTGIEGGGSTGIGFFNSSSGTVTTAANGGNISIMANSMNITAPVSTNTSSSVTLKPFSSGVAMDLGSTSDPIGGPLGLSDTELDLVTTGTLIIGSATAGNITVSSAISLPAATNVQLRSGGDITFNQNFNTSGGTLLLAPGNAPAAVKPTFTGTDATASTVSFASDLSIAINGTTPGNGTGSTFTRLTVAGSVDLTGVDLVFSGAYGPVLGNTFTIVDNDGADAIVNTFTGLGEGATISNFLSSGLNATITYLGGDGNDVVITVVESCIPITTIGAISGPVGVCRGATNQVFTVAPVPGATSYQWIIPNGATGSSTTNSITLGFGTTYNTGMVAVKAISACNQTTLAVKQVQVFLSKPGQPKFIQGKNLGVCTGNEVYSISAVGYATSYTWVAPANTRIVSGQGTASIELSFAPGFVSGNLSVRASNCMGTSTARTMMLRTKPATPASITGPSSVCPGEAGVKFSTTGLAGVTYNWLVPAGATITNGQGTAAITVTWGNAAGNVRVSAGNICGTSAIRSKAVSLLSCITTITMAQAEQVQADPAENRLEVKLWPNPARDVLMVTLDEFIPNQKLELTLMQADGKVQAAQSLTPTVKGQQVRMDVSRMAAGYYILSVKQKDMHMGKKVVIIR